MFSINAMAMAWRSSTSRTTTGTFANPARSAARQAAFAGDDFEAARRTRADDERLDDALGANRLGQIVEALFADPGSRG